MENIKNVFGKLMNNKLILVILIIGVAFIFMPSEKEEIKVYENEYEKNLIAEAQRILGKIEGAGEVSVMMTFYDKGRAVPLTDKNEKGEVLSEKTVSVSGKVALLREEYPSVRGVVIVCEGGDSEKVKEDMINAVSALTGAPIHSIKVFKMEG